MIELINLISEKVVLQILLIMILQESELIHIKTTTLIYFWKKVHMRINSIRIFLKNKCFI